MTPLAPKHSEALKDSPYYKSPAGTMPETAYEEYDHWCNDKILFLFTFTNSL